MKYSQALPKEVLDRINTLGSDGQDWMETLDERVARLAGQWHLTPGAVLSGGSESLVLHAQTAAGDARVLKVGLPGSVNAEREALALRLADGRGYATLYAHSTEHNALLIEALGETLDQAEPSEDKQLWVLADLLASAWLPVSDPSGLWSGAGKLHWLRDFIARNYAAQSAPCPEPIVTYAYRCIENRLAAPSSRAVLVHGDGHAANALRAADGTFKLVDPEGLHADPACDLAVLMREWDSLIEPDPKRLALARCRALSERTEVAADAIWEWGYIERVSTGLHLLELGWNGYGEQMLGIAHAIAGSTP